MGAAAYGQGDKRVEDFLYAQMIRLSSIRTDNINKAVEQILRELLASDTVNLESEEGYFSYCAFYPHRERLN